MIRSLNNFFFRFDIVFTYFLRNMSNDEDIQLFIYAIILYNIQYHITLSYLILYNSILYYPILYSAIQYYRFALHRR